MRIKLENKGKIKRGPKNPFKDAETHVYHFDKKEGLFHPKYGSDDKVVDCFKELLTVFENKHITNIPVENIFSMIKKLIDFRGKRMVEYFSIANPIFFHGQGGSIDFKRNS
ncbi:MAG: hypothetical protein ACTSR8_12805 [Promethearchaeota archaeon]